MAKLLEGYSGPRNQELAIINNNVKMSTTTNHPDPDRTLP